MPNTELIKNTEVIKSTELIKSTKHIKSAQLIDQIPCANILGEGVQWNHREQAVWWVDIKSNIIFRYHLASKALQTWATPEPVGCFAFAENDERILLALASGFAWFDKNTGDVEWLAKPEAHLVGNRLNDGRVDRQGRFWAGSIVEQKKYAGAMCGFILFGCSRRCIATSHRIGDFQ